ncbi:hypothetical protein F4820DRAFT_431744 [Hypoxylon rubiginosum]|uniref:Uncharacterized protein n=1 Tax=Hypoxylon rubiginosum TaxID=110542 RepID=A0ACB9YRW0_9PEZI|nr:hypothetical protein F4820DRAFT_431744 [Hypoxylon rubiginosum]
MAPPPATPTPHRFLVPKRSQPRQETPKAFQAGGQQFQATPRFSLHSSTPRGSGSGGGAPSSSSAAAAAARTPASAGAASLGAGAFFRPTPRNTDPINDVVSSSPPFAEQEGPGVGDGKQQQRDPIDVEADADADSDVDVDAVPESSPIRQRSSSDRDVGSSEGEEDGLRSRSPKRRRISISSDFGLDNEESSPQRGHEEDADLDQDIDMIQSSIPLPLPLPLPIHAPPSSSDADADADVEAVVGSPLTPKPTPAAQQQQQQPTFHKPPRFKPAADAPEGSHRHGDPLPDAFSPHRRKGAKYVPGGLAASVRDWFVDVWAGATTGAGAGAGAAARRDGGGSNSDGWVARVRVDEVKAAPGMALITGRHVRDDDDNDEHEHDGDAGLRGVRVVLAGSPRVAGLAKREDVRQGSVVGIGRPTWEVSIQDQGHWAVVCEWAIL